MRSYWANLKRRKEQVANAYFGKTISKEVMLQMKVERNRVRRKTYHASFFLIAEGQRALTLHGRGLPLRFPGAAYLCCTGADPKPLKEIPGLVPLGCIW